MIFIIQFYLVLNYQLIKHWIILSFPTHVFLIFFYNQLYWRIITSKAGRPSGAAWLDECKTLHSWSTVHYAHLELSYSFISFHSHHTSIHASDDLIFVCEKNKLILYIVLPSCFPLHNFFASLIFLFLYFIKTKWFLLCQCVKDIQLLSTIRKQKRSKQELKKQQSKTTG